MASKENLLKAIDSAISAAEECEQTIEVRAALIRMKRARAFANQAKLAVQEVVEETVKKEVVEEKKEPVKPKKNTKKGGVQKK